MLDVEKMAETLLAGTRALIAKEMGPLRAENERLSARLKEVEAREYPEIPEMPDVAKMIDEAFDAIPEPEPVETPDIEKMVADAVAEIPPAKDGEDGNDAVLPDIEKMVADAVAEIPPAKDGEDGNDAVLPDIEKMVADAVAAIPAPVIPDPIPGRDGLSIVEVKQNDDGELIVKMTNGETINAGAVRGAAGIGFDDLTFEHDGERGAVLRFQRGDVCKEFAFNVPSFIDRGVWSEGEFAKGDAVTWGGSLWIAQNVTKEKPGVTKDWRLAVKKGRDAKPSVRAD